MLPYTSHEFLAWLQKLCLPDWQATRGLDAIRKRLTLPWSWDGWTGATDARFMVAVRAVLPGIEPLTDAEGRSVAAYLGEPRRVTGQQTLSLAALKEWCGPAVYQVPCPACKGVSRDNPYVVCTFCEGDGVTSVEADCAALLGTPLDRRKLSCFLECLDSDTVTVTTTRMSHGEKKHNAVDAEYGAVFVECAEWRVVCMPMTQTLAEQRTLEQFPALSGPARQMIENADPEESPMVADYLSEHGWPHLAAVWRRSADA